MISKREEEESWPGEEPATTAAAESNFLFLRRWAFLSPSNVFNTACSHCSYNHASNQFLQVSQEERKSLSFCWKLVFAISCVFCLPQLLMINAFTPGNMQATKEPGRKQLACEKTQMALLGLKPPSSGRSLLHIEVTRGGGESELNQLQELSVTKWGKAALTKTRFSSFSGRVFGCHLVATPSII